MVAIGLPSLDLSDASSLHVVVGMLAATLLAYKLVFSKPPHEQYAVEHGLTHIKPARRLPQSHVLWGDALELQQNATRFVDWVYEETVEMDGQPWLRQVPFLSASIMLASPALIEDVTKTQNDVFGKGEFTRTVFYDLVGDGFFSQDSDKWFHQSKITSKFFSARMFRDVATPMIHKHAEELFAVLEAAVGTEVPVNLSQLLHEFTLQTIAELGFGLQMDLIGSEHGHPLDRALEDAFPQILRRVQTHQWMWRLQRFLNVGGERQYKHVTGEICRM